MKLAYLANIRLPTEKAHGIQVMKTCEALARLGHEVTLIVPRRRNVIAAEPFDYYGVQRNFSIRIIPVFDFLALPFLKRLGFLLETASFVKSLLWHLRRETFDAYYTRDLAVAAFSGKTPLFYEIHSLPERSTWLHRRAWKRARGIVVISEGLKSALVAQGVPEQKILLARDAVDIGQFQISESREACRVALHLPADKKIAVYTGHLYAWKGADILARAAEFLHPKANPEPRTSNLEHELVEVYLVGGTDEDIATFRKRYHAPNLHIVGRQEPSKIPLWLKAADVLVLPTSGRESIGARYTSPMKLFEYMASGTPMVVSDLPSLREVVDSSAVFLVKPDDIRALAEGIALALSDNKHARRLAGLAQARVMEYSWENRAKRIADFINRHD